MADATLIAFSDLGLGADGINDGGVLGGILGEAPTAAKQPRRDQAESERVFLTSPIFWAMKILRFGTDAAQLVGMVHECPC